MTENENATLIPPYFDGKKKGENYHFQRGALVMKPVYKLSLIGRVS